MAIIRYTKDATIRYAYLNIFPDQFKTEKEKQDESWVKNTMDYFANKAYAEYVKNRDTFVKNYDLVKGILRPEDFYMNKQVKSFVDTIVDNISLRTERKIEMDLQLSVTTSAHALADFANHLRDFLKSENDLNSYQVFVSESGKQHHALHVECLVNMQMDIDAFQMIRERINLAAIEYANTNQIQFSEKG